MLHQKTENMKKLRYVYDPHKQLLVVFEDNHMIGGYNGQIAERKLEKLLLTDVKIELGQFLTAKERQDKELINQSLKGGNQ